MLINNNLKNTSSKKLSVFFYLCLGFMGLYAIPTLYAEESSEFKTDTISIEPEIIELATIRFSNGNVLNFFETAGSKDIFVEEMTAIETGEIFIFKQLKGSLLDKYLTLTPEDTPVPERLVSWQEDLLDHQQKRLNHSEKSPDQMNDGVILVAEPVRSDLSNEPLPLDLSSRHIVAKLESDVYVDVESLGMEHLVNLTFDKAGGLTGSCDVISGADYFEQNHCFTDGSIGWNSNSSFHKESYCFEDSHSSLQKTSYSPRRVTYARVANCDRFDLYGQFGHPSTLSFLSKTSQWYRVDLSRRIPPRYVAAYEWYTQDDYIKRVKVKNSTYPGEYSRTWIRYYTFRQSSGE
ncbi:hypothetical protein MNBD_GAMMA02-1409 [hydrothermal vent metagenome]|uniref:Uncharacterized protein n=1 Tax=hydrothermal vent metagenome TaxID=652676 RepID=A0A3B0WAU2_9ZZZZ